MGLIFIGAGIWMFSSRNDFPPPSMDALVYQGAAEEQSVRDSRIALAKHKTDGSFDKVTAFYMSQFGRTYGDPSLTSSGIRIFNLSYGLRALASTGNEPRPAAVSKTFIRQTNSAFYFVYVSSPSTNAPASVLTASFRFAARTGDVSPLLSSLLYPNALPGSSVGGRMRIQLHRYTTKDSLEEVWRYYTAKAGLQTDAAGGTVIPLFDKAPSAATGRNYVALFPEVNGADLRERGLVRFENEQAVFLTVSRGKDDDKTHITLTGVAW